MDHSPGTSAARDWCFCIRCNHQGCLPPTRISDCCLWQYTCGVNGYAHEGPQHNFSMPHMYNQRSLHSILASDNTLCSFVPRWLPRLTGAIQCICTSTMKSCVIYGTGKESLVHLNQCRF